MKIFLTDIDLANNEIKRLKIHNSATHPVNPVESNIYYNTTEKIFYGWNGSFWTALSNMAGGQIDMENFVLVADDGANITFDTARSPGLNTVLSVPNTDVVNLVKCNYNATGNPTANNDYTQGYTVGSQWINSASYRAWTCVNSGAPSNPGSAIWSENTNYVRSYTASFSTSSQVTITHNLKSTLLVYKIYKNDGEEFIPGKFQVLNENQVYIEMNPPLNGFIVIVAVRTSF